MVNRKEAKGYVVSYRYVAINAVDMLNRLGERGRSGDILTHITCPVLVIHSRGDDAASFEASVRAFHEIKSTDKRFISLERSNHHVFCDYEREEVISEIVKFCVGKR